MYSVSYAIPKDVQVEVNGREVIVKGKAGESRRSFNAKHVEIKKADGNITVFTNSVKKADRADVGTILGHIKNMVVGAEKGVTYKLKSVYAHFPMSIKVEGNRFVVSNFLGEKFPRSIELIKDVTVKITGPEVTVTGSNREVVGLCASQIEQVCRIRDRDRRVFQDGIYIIEKDGKHLK
jgi:large subunit ribosomal protein L6